MLTQMLNSVTRPWWVNNQRNLKKSILISSGVNEISLKISWMLNQLLWFLAHVAYCLITAINTLRLSGAYMRQWIGSALVQIMARCLFSAKPLSKLIMGYCQFDPRGQTSVKFLSKYRTFHSRKCIWKCRLRKLQPFCPGGRWVNTLRPEQKSCHFTDNFKCILLNKDALL